MAMMKVQITLWILIVSADNLSGARLTSNDVQKNIVKTFDNKTRVDVNCNLTCDLHTCICHCGCAECSPTKSTEKSCPKSNLCPVDGDSKLKDDGSSTNIPEGGIPFHVKQCRPQCLDELSTKSSNVSANSGNSSCNTEPNTEQHSYLGTYLTIGGAVCAMIIIILIIVIVTVRVFRKREEKCTPDKYDDPFDRVIADLEYHYYDDPEILGCDNANLNHDEDVRPNQQKEVNRCCRKLPAPPEEAYPVYTKPI